MPPRTFIDGTEVTDLVQSGTSTHYLNKRWECEVQIPVADAQPDWIGKLLRVEDVVSPGVIDFHGRICFESAEDGEDGDGLISLTGYDARELWPWRPARDLDGDYSKPDFLVTYQSGPQIMEQVLTASEIGGGGTDPAFFEGPLEITYPHANFAVGGVDLSGAPADFPISIEDLANLLTSTGELDLVLTPVNPGGGITAELHAYNGNFGNDLTATVEYRYGDGGNVKTVRRTRDLSKMVNKLRYLLGPKYDDQHWKMSIEGTNAIFSTGPYAPPGGQSVDSSNNPVGPPWTNNPLGELIYDSRIAYGVRSEVRTYDTFGNEAAGAPLYWRLWQDESIYRAQPRTLYKVTPVDGWLPDFEIGDQITVTADALFLGGFTGVQRIYGRPLSWDQEGVVSMGEFLTSDDGDAA